MGLAIRVATVMAGEVKVKMKARTNTYFLVSKAAVGMKLEKDTKPETKRLDDGATSDKDVCNTAMIFKYIVNAAARETKTTSRTSSKPTHRTPNT